MTRRLVSVWQPFFLQGDSPVAAVAAANELEELGYDRIWFSAGFGDGVPRRFREVLDGTGRIGVAPGILSIWHSTPAEAAAFAADAERDHPGRFLLGLGASHAPIVEQDGTGYLGLPNYTNNLRRFGWTDEDLAGGGSDRLVDAVIPWGTPEQVAAGIEKHYQAGADEVAIQVLNNGDAATFPADAFRTLAAILI